MKLSQLLDTASTSRDFESTVNWLKSRSSRFIPFVATRIQEFQDSHNDVKQELRYVPSAFSPADMLTKPIVVEGLQTWYEGSDFRKLPESSWPENNDIPEPDSVLLERRKPKVKNYRKTRRVLAVQADIAEGQDFGSRLIRIFASWSKLLETIALSKVILRRKSFVLYENVSLDVREEIWLTKEATIKLCQELKNNLKKTRIIDLASTLTIVVLFEAVDASTNPICLMR